jgi:hypothetical protein
LLDKLNVREISFAFKHAIECRIDRVVPNVRKKAWISVDNFTVRNTALYYTFYTTQVSPFELINHMASCMCSSDVFDSLL